MKRSRFAKPLKHNLLAVPAAALMLGAAHAGTTVGLNFQAWYYDSGATPQTVGYGAGYQTTGFPVTATAFGVPAANWFNSDPLPCQQPISGYATFGGVNTVFAGGLTANLSAANAWQSGIGEQVAGWHPETVPPGNDEVTWGYLDSNSTQSPAVTVAGLSSVFSHGYVVQTIAAETGSATYNNMEISDGVTTDTVAYATSYVTGTASDGYDSGNGTVGLSAPSGLFTSDTLYLAAGAQTSPNRSTLAGFIITDQPVVSAPPTGGGYVVGQSINLSVGAIGVPPLNYQWRSNGVPIIGATAAAYTKSGASVGAYNYDVVVTNLYGGTTSEVAAVTVAIPATLTWDAGASALGAQDGSGTWDNGVTANWWNGSGAVAWGSLDNAVFGAGGTGPYTVTVASSVSANSLTFNTGDYTVAGAGITLAGEALIQVNTNATVSLPLAGTSGLTLSGTGTLNLTGVNTFTGNLSVNGGTLQGGTTQGSAAAGYLGAVNGARTITIASGAAIAINNNNVFGGGGMSASELPTVVINGGTFNSTRYNSIGKIVLNSGATLSQSATDSGSYQGYELLGSITAGGSSASTISTGNGKADHLLGGETNTFDVADVTGDASSDLIVSAPLIDGSGDYPGAGALLKSGGGTLELSGVDSYTGTTTVSNGTLLVSGELNGSGDINLNDATALNVAANLNSPVIPAGGNLTLGGGGTSTNALGFANLNSTTVAPINVGTLSVINPTKVNITGVIALAGSYPLINYSGESGGGAITLGSLPAGVSGTLVDNHASSVTLNVTATPVQSEVWAGTPTGVWNINNTANWTIGGGAAKYEEADVVTFDDTASGTTAVTLNTVVHPAIVTFDNTAKTYSINGAGSIAGATALNVNGPGLVTLSNTNTYAGGTIINAGTLAAAADTNLGSGPLTLNGGTLDIIGATAFVSAKSVALNNNGATVQVDNLAGATLGPISGGGALTKTGNGVLTLNSLETYAGGTTVNGGTLNLGIGGASGTLQGPLTVNSNATVVCLVNNALGYSGANWVQNITLDFGSLVTAIAGSDNGWGTTINLTGGTLGTTVAGGYFTMGNGPVFNVTGANVPSVISADLHVRDTAGAGSVFNGGITFNVTRGTAATDLNVTGNIVPSATGGVLLTGNGILQLAGGNNSYTGTTEVQGGTLKVTGSLTDAGFVTVDDGAELDVSSGGVPAILTTTGDLTLGGGGGAVTLAFANIYSASVPLISVVNLTVNDPVAVNISGKVAVGQFPLIHFAGVEGGPGAFTLAALPAGVSATLTTNLANSTLDLLVTSAPLSIIRDVPSGTNDAYAGANYSLSVGAGGSPVLGYQWFFDGGPISGATAATLTLTRLTTANDGSYYVMVTNASGSVTSSTNHLVVVPDSGYAALALATGPVAFWPLDEASGTTAFDIWGGNNATYSGTYTLDYETNPHAGTPGVHFNGSSGLALTPYVAALNPAVFTAEAWVNPDTSPSSEFCVLSCGQFASPRSGWLIYQFAGYWDFRTYYGNGLSIAAEVVGTTAPVLGEWTHLAVTWDGTNASLYVNGTRQNTTVSTASPPYLPGASGGFSVAARADGSFYFPGVVSDAAIYNRVLTAQEIQTHAQGQPDLTITPSGGETILSWVPSGGGTLVASPVVSGPYTNVRAATSPWTNTPAGNQFFRVKF